VSEPEVLATRLAEALEAGEPLSPATHQRLFAALVTGYAQSHRDLAEPPFTEGSVAAEAVALTAAAMLRAGAITSFELAALFNV